MYRIAFFLIATFWVTMTCLLWRSEFGERDLGTSIPVEKVWEKVLTAPDNSNLDIFHHRKKIGYCRWTPNVGEDAISSGQVSSDEYLPEGIVKRVSHYRLEIEGNVQAPTLTNNLRFELSMVFTTNQTWQDFSLRVSVRPHSWEISASSTNDLLHVAVDDQNGAWEHDFAFADLQNPEKLMEEFGGPVAMALLGSMGLKSQAGAKSKLTAGLEWKAYNDWMRFGHSRVRVYRLEAQILGRLKVFLFVSRVGEILWVHLPEEIVGSNNAFEHF